VAAAVLIAAASLKLASLFRLATSARTQLLLPSVVFPFLSEWVLIKLVAATECLVACVVLCSRGALVRFSLIAWLATVFLAYHLCLRAVAQGAPCHCLGSWGAASQATIDLLAGALLAVLLAIGWGGLSAHAWRMLAAWLKASRARRSSGL
jgi:hypothetical protein